MWDENPAGMMSEVEGKEKDPSETACTEEVAHKR